MNYSPRKLLMVASLALASLSLTACGGFGAAEFDAQKRLATLPGDLKACIYKLVPQPSSIQTKAQIAKVIADLKASENAKTYCGERIINLYESQMDLH